MGVAQYPSSPTTPDAPARSAGEAAADALERALRLVRDGAPETALAALDDAIEARPQTAEAWRSKAQILLQLGRVPEAITVLDKGLARLGRAEASLLTDKAALLLFSEDFGAAAATFDRLIALEPLGAAHHLGKGRARLSEGKPEEALSCAEAALKLDPHLPQAHELRGDALLRLKRWEDSFAAFAAAADRDPRQFGSSNWAARGEEFRKNRQPDFALEAYRRAIAADTTNPEGHHGIGLVLREQGDVEGALTAFVQASEADKNFVAGFLDAGALCVEHNQLTRALDYFQRATLLPQESGAPAERDDPRPWLAIGGVHERLGNNEEARAAYERATKSDPQNAEAWNYLGNTLAHLDRVEDAVASYRRAIELRSDFGWAHYNLTFMLLRQGQFEEALKSSEAAIRLNPDNGDFWIGKLIVLDTTDGFDQAAVDGALNCTGADDKLRIDVANFLAESDRPDAARELLSAIDAAQIGDPRMQVSLAESLLLVGEDRRAADMLPRIADDALDLSRKTVRALLHLLADRLAGDTGGLSEPLLGDCLDRLKTRIAEIERRGRKWDYLSIGWNFKGVRRVIVRSALPMSDRLVLATLIDLAEAKIRPDQLSFFTLIPGSP